MKIRNQKVVHKDTQGEFLFLNVATVMLLTIGILVAVIIFLSDNFAGLIGPLTPQETIITIMSAGTLILGILLVTLQLNQGLSGPLLVLRNSLDRLGHGDLSTRIHLRKADRLKELGDAFNKNVGELDRRLSRVKEGAEKLEEAVSDDERLQPLAQDLVRVLEGITTSYDKAR